jgi:hypothetical protein
MQRAGTFLKDTCMTANFGLSCVAAVKDLSESLVDKDKYLRNDI